MSDVTFGCYSAFATGTDANNRRSICRLYHRHQLNRDIIIQERLSYVVRRLRLHIHNDPTFTYTSVLWMDFSRATPSTYKRLYEWVAKHETQQQREIRSSGKVGECCFLIFGHAIDGSVTHSLKHLRRLLAKQVGINCIFISITSTFQRTVRKEVSR